MKQTAIHTATLTFNAEGTPVSREFDDVYFSNDNGLEETRYVFLDGNNLPERFTGHAQSTFYVAESGFGTGLNFLTLWQTFATFRQNHPEAAVKRLHFISFEKFPLSVEDLALAHAHWPELAPFSEALRARWPMPWPGCHRLLFGHGNLTLDLWFGDINQLVSQLDDSYNGQIDAWFLDGFAPAKNPDMWTPTLFNAMARLARPHGTLATFTSAGFVRRALIEAGFQMVKRKGFGRKREMLVGKRIAGHCPTPVTPWYARPAARGRETAIIGGGVASALLSLMLLRRGWDVTLYCADDTAGEGASGNRQGALYPLLSAHDPVINGFFPTAFGFARRLYDSLDIEFDRDWCGVTQLGWDEKSRLKIDRMLSLAPPLALARPLTADEAAQECGVPTGCGGIHYPHGGWLCPQQLTRATLALGIKLGLKVHYRHTVISLNAKGSQWQLVFKNGRLAQHAAVVIANGAALTDFEQTTALPVYPVAGQVSHIPETPALAPLRQVLCYDGYLTPVNPTNGHHCIGASYHRNQRQAAYSEEDQQHNRQRLINCLPHQPWTQTVDVSAQEARNGVRCATRDHLPLVGNAPDYETLTALYADLQRQAENPQHVAPAPCYHNLFVLGALGSRGLCSAPLAAEILASQMSGEPLPLDATTLAGLHPGRYWVRKLLKGRPV